MGNQFDNTPSNEFHYIFSHQNKTYLTIFGLVVDNLYASKFNTDIVIECKHT